MNNKIQFLDFLSNTIANFDNLSVLPIKKKHDYEIKEGVKIWDCGNKIIIESKNLDEINKKHNLNWSIKDNGHIGVCHFNNFKKMDKEVKDDRILFKNRLEKDSECENVESNTSEEIVDNYKKQFDNYRPENSFFFNRVEYGYEAQNIVRFISMYRNIEERSLVKKIVEEIVGEIIVVGMDRERIIDVKFSPAVFNKNSHKRLTRLQNIVRTAFYKVYNLLRFEQLGQEYFRRFFIDGRVVIHMNYDHKNPKEGLATLDMLDPLLIQRQPYSSKWYINLFSDINSTGMNVENYKNFMLQIEKLSNKEDDKDLYEYGIIEDADLLTVHSQVWDIQSFFYKGFLHDVMDDLSQYFLVKNKHTSNILAKKGRIISFDIKTSNTQKREEVFNTKVQAFSKQVSGGFDLDKVLTMNRFEHTNNDIFLASFRGEKSVDIVPDTSREEIDYVDAISFYMKNICYGLNFPYSRINPEDMKDESPYLSTSVISKEETTFLRNIRNIKNKFNELFYEVIGREIFLTEDLEMYNLFHEVKGKISFEYFENLSFAEIKYLDTIQRRLDISREFIEISESFQNYKVNENFIINEILKFKGKEFLKKESGDEDNDEIPRPPQL